MSLLVEILAALGLVRVGVDLAAAARLFAAAETVADESGHPLVQFQRRMFEEGVAAVRDDLADQFGHEWEAGRTLTPDEAVALALAEKP
jgi:hypothetical protein